MKSADIREAFLKYFESNGHQIVSSSSLVPGNDPTLLFVNAGMVPFKDVFLGLEKRNYFRATSSQKCVRAGGKHNDLENVGYTARHHTFFEMLGNFSFGDYFKAEAIKFAWEFLTKVLGLPEERLWVTVHVSDDEAADIWLKEVGVSADRFSRLDEDNFWQMGDTGPCGPSSEVFYDHGKDVPGGPPGSENDDLDRYIEVWNLVFMQYERQSDGSLLPLPKPSVDTGMGLERMAAVLQGVHSNYDIDLFQNLLAAVGDVVGVNDKTSNSLRVIADHIRSCAFLIADGVTPSNEGRGYVLRRIIRRAIRHGHKLGQKETFFFKLVPALCQEMGEAYPELVENKLQIEKSLQAEEEQFAKTLDKGLTVLNDQLKKLDNQTIPGDIVFTLYDTYGFPVDLTNDIARENKLQLDLAGYETLMEEQRQRARASGAFKVDYTDAIDISGETAFEGYQHLSKEAKIVAIIVDGQSLESIESGQEAAVVLDGTPFYAESGGQVGDSGRLEGEGLLFEVEDCQKASRHHLHIGKLIRGSLKKGGKVIARVNSDARQATALNHSATHLLHAALRDIVGSHVAQKGSLVNALRLRFDFSHFEALKPNELRAIEEKVNQEIRKNSKVETQICDIEAAKSKGAIALFGEKYEDEVRMLSMGEGYSVELCGGTHVECTGEIGFMKIVSEAGIASGVRRIEAVTGVRAMEKVQQQDDLISKATILLKSSPEGIIEKLEQICLQNKSQEKEISQLKNKLVSASIDEWVSEAKESSGIKVLVKSVELETKSLRDTVDKLKAKLGKSAVLLASVSDGKISLVAGVSKEVTSKLKAGDIVKELAPKIDGKGGGRPDMAQGGGSNVVALPGAIEDLKRWIDERLLGN